MLCSSFCVDLFNGKERNHSFCFSVKLYFLGLVSVHYTAGKSSHYAVIRWELWLWQGGAMKGKFVPFQIFTCALVLQPSPPMFSFPSWSCLATLAAYSHFPGQFSGEGKIMQAMQTHLGVGRNLETQDLGVFPGFIIVIPRALISCQTYVQYMIIGKTQPKWWTTS